ncbi:MAG TPA: amino acid dehydrogenase [Bacteroidetes bacterium]|nr:amino acid dehydrogenase [Bacteroidota bacterium]
MGSVKQKLIEFKSRKPKIVFEWTDEDTGAKGWIVINSLRGGAAGGGTRMRLGCDRDEVESLAKTMEIKFTVSGPAIGGAKSGIDFDPNDPRKEQVLKKWYKAVYPILKTYYGTGGDLNIDEVKHVIPITESYGLWHPQEGVVNGHFRLKEHEKMKLIGQLRLGVSKIIENPLISPDVSKQYNVADMITGFGVSESVKHFYKIFKNEDLQGKKVIIQGWGNVGSASAFYLTQLGAIVVGIIDKNAGIIVEEGLGYEDIRALFLKKDNNKLVSERKLSFKEVNDRIWDISADIFIPAAASKLVKRDQIQRLISSGLIVMACGANVPFSDDDFLFGPTAEIVDEKISYIPDFIANCGMARTFAYLMQPGVEVTDEAKDANIHEFVSHWKK